MTSEHSRCPICDSSSVVYREDLAVWTCDDCSGVFEDSEFPLSVEKVRQVQTLEQSENESDSQQWSNQIAPKDNSEANLVRYLETVEELTHELTLTSEIEIRAAEITTEAWKSNFMHGRSSEESVGACLYLASRECGYSVPPGLISDALQQEKSAIKHTYKHLKSELDIEPKPATPAEFVPYICESLQLPTCYEEDALTLLTHNNIPGGNPIGVAAGAIYLVGKHETDGPTQRELALTTDLTKETIYRKSSELSEYDLRSIN